MYLTNSQSMKTPKQFKHGMILSEVNECKYRPIILYQGHRQNVSLIHHSVGVGENISILP